MPAVSATAPGKIILFGEHAVVYGKPAVAVPVTQVRAKATVTADPTGPSGQVHIAAPQIDLNCRLDELPPAHPLAQVIALVAGLLNINRLPALRLQITSTIPIAAGLGSGAAVSAASARALGAFLGHPLTDEQVSQIAYQVDRTHHGNPSGIDNTVVAFAQPVVFVRGQPFQRLVVGQPIQLIIGNTGIASPTGAAVEAVRQGWLANPDQYEHWFNEIGDIAQTARQIIETGPVDALGPLMTRNQALLKQMTVSSPELDHLVAAALAAGAGGAKLCGGGRGGNMIALVTASTAESVEAALRAAGATHTIHTTIGRG